MKIRSFREISPTGTALGLFIILGHLYLAHRVVLPAGLEPAWRNGLLGALGAMAVLTLALPVINGLPRKWATWLAWPGFAWMGLGLILMTVLVLTDLFAWALGTPQAIAADTPEDTPLLDPVTVIGLTVGLVVAAIGFTGAVRPPRIHRVSLAVPGWPAERDGYRIVQISDLHIGTMLGRRFARAITARCNRLKADMVAITGDLVDGPVHRLLSEVAPFGKLKARDGVFFVTGNHDHYADADGWCDAARNLGMVPLRDEVRTIGKGSGAISVAGVDDAPGCRKDDLDQALAGCPPNRPVLLLAHDPELFHDAAERGVSLQLSGHTHGGQIWPLGFLVRLTTPFVAGLFQKGGSHLYVSRGTGFWGPPFRLLAAAEITLIEVSPG